ncbi:ATP-binding protein [Streptomyces litchfieldiae]|uniref:ATP-binding protein n=1 Tax=Streptomyces litchfieldiae TaxID=3075543 RepID=A0ABU2MSK0_9ACTN|nr:ATP-binding protein [Streptomyces sp. DSM 44938]MDT0344367.1 ATP-binding protein [Streptomyces sp. DSM 44938]
MTALPFAVMAPDQARRLREGVVDAGGFATFPLAVARETPGEARRATRTTLRGWGLEALVDDATVVVSELVTNALRYGLPPSRPAPLPPASRERPILLSLVHCGGAVLCAVFDPGHDVPRVKEPDYYEESGRGLHVLESLAERWGWTAPDHYGKAVWALLMRPGDAEPVAPGASDWEPLTRLLLLLELLSGPSWLKSLGASAAKTAVAHRR